MPGAIPHGTLTGHLCHQLQAEADDPPCANAWTFWFNRSQTPGYPGEDEFNTALNAAQAIVAP